MVGVSPPYDPVAKMTSVAAADLIIDILAVMVKNKDGLLKGSETKDEL
jgi:agmatinase